ncbi:hypothetical protein BDV96DRAFT_593284 [Lophiotrema nucula]|uniref:Uncharacterized protein n=1 Tax=Lophiotrema nucula TaxID=690887 RepID=A0A6A5ZVF5_9PLEO|nr:hypothetical protein BDV96DRAFT_593284 [Lophiotrema nucula]
MIKTLLILHAQVTCIIIPVQYGLYPESATSASDPSRHKIPQTLSLLKLSYQKRRLPHHPILHLYRPLGLAARHTSIRIPIYIHTLNADLHSAQPALHFPSPHTKSNLTSYLFPSASHPIVSACPPISTEITNPSPHPRHTGSTFSMINKSSAPERPT